ncbi:hypothetical protein ACQB60_03585 [Actinomycetota bacterium Odt1-20B]
MSSTPPQLPVPSRALLSRHRTAGALALCAAVLLSTLTGCAPAPARPHVLSSADIIRAAQQQLTDRCLLRQGLTPPRPGRHARSEAEEQRMSGALFGSGRTELSLTLPTGYSVRAHTDGCLAAAQRSLYGDQRRWFHASTIVNNLKPEAAHGHDSLASVRDRHRADIAEWQRLRARALTRAKAQLTRQRQNTHQHQKENVSR